MLSKITMCKMRCSTFLWSSNSYVTVSHCTLRDLQEDPRVVWYSLSRARALLRGLGVTSNVDVSQIDFEHSSHLLSQAGHLLINGLCPGVQGHLCICTCPP